MAAEKDEEVGLEEEGSGFDLDSAIDSVAAGVLGGEEKEGEGEGEKAPAPVSEPTPPSPSVEAKALPKSWKREMEAHWAKLPAEVHDYVYAREADVMRGLQQYAQGYKQWEAATKPFAEVFQRSPNLNPVNAFHALMQAHLQLSQGSPEQKRQHFQKLAADYGVQLGVPVGDTGSNPLQGELSRLQEELHALKSHFTESQRRTYEAAVSDQRKAVDAFFADSKNEFAEEVQADILRLIQTGAVADLPTAYEQACWLNPSVRAKMLAKQQAQSAPDTNSAAKKFPNIESDPNAKPARQRKMTMEDTINGIVAKYANSLG
jgi:hypothetical protein